MTLKINKNYLKYCYIAFLLLLDASLLLLIKNSISLIIPYLILNAAIIISYCYKSSIEDSAIFSILFMIFYTFFIDIFIHYFHKIVIFEAEFLFVLPMLLTCLKIKKNRAKLFTVITLIYFILNMIILVFTSKVSLINYALFLPNLLSFIGFYYIYSNIEGTQKLKEMYKFIFVISLLLTLVETLAGFNEDTRNGLFSVFGWGAYTFFIMILLMYNLKKYMNKEYKLINVIIALVICGALYICTESKAAIVFMIINVVALLSISKGVTKKKIIFLLISIALIPISYKILIHFTPKFSHLNSFSQIMRYFIGNNNTRYEYGRFEALANVFSYNDSFAKIFGIGFGGSCPLYKVFFEELGRTPIFPYYTNLYGYKYGYQHTTSAIALLDGGILFFSMIIIFLISKIYKSIKNIRSSHGNTIDYIRFGILTYLVYYFTYANVLKDFRIMALLGIVLGMSKLEDSKQSGGGENDKNCNSVQ